jgi:hypothetical protein
MQREDEDWACIAPLDSSIQHAGRAQDDARLAWCKQSTLIAELVRAFVSLHVCSGEAVCPLQDRAKVRRVSKAGLF